MPDLLTEAEQEFLMKQVNSAIEVQTARIALEKKSLGKLYVMRADLRNCRLPDKIEKVKDGMVTLEMLNSTRR